jgi:hypothetical protein
MQICSQQRSTDARDELGFAVLTPQILVRNALYPIGKQIKVKCRAGPG